MVAVFGVVCIFVFMAFVFAVGRRQIRRGITALNEVVPNQVIPWAVIFRGRALIFVDSQPGWLKGVLGSGIAAWRAWDLQIEARG
jgi:hypothetical protein